MDIKEFEKQPVMGIVRGIEIEHTQPLIEAVIESGLKTLEITMNTPNAEKIIRLAVKAANKRLTLGAGTVLDMESLKQALYAGATFIVMPVLIKDVMEYCVKKDIPAFPGALSVQEIHDAWKAGASMVKVFPVKFFGPEYLREVKAPLNEVKLLACAGVTPQNMNEYFSCGANAIAFGASVFRKDWLQNKEYSKISSSIRAYLQQLN